MNLKKERTSRGLTQLQLAKLAGVGICTIRNIEQGIRMPNDLVMSRIKLALKKKKKA